MQKYNNKLKLKIMIQIGDTVRFLNDVGGGVVTQVDRKKNLVYVEDKDGFEIPVLEKECVVVGEVYEKTNFPKKNKTSSKNSTHTENKITSQPKEEEKKEEEPIIETREGEELKVLLAFFPDDVKKLTDSDFECFLINDSNYFLFYNVVIGEENKRKSIANGIVEPHLQVFLSDVAPTELNLWENMTVQITAFKREKTYQTQRVIDTEIKLPVVKFYKLHSFSTNDYFDEPSILIDIVAESQKKRLKNISPKEIKKAMMTKEIKEEKRSFSTPNKKPKIIEVDLHITELLDSTAGMSSSDILNYQMETFHRVIEENKNHKGQKIVFIHGKGEGILRKQITQELKNRYKHLKFQDASFKEYGFGATMVII